jgi:succinate dehydrogenase / fumarate reductase, membrane anchor subunit
MATNKIFTGARYGLRDWLAQRITAVVLSTYAIWLVIRAFMIDGKIAYGTWAEIFVPAYAKVFTLVALTALLYHVWVGVRDIYMDYIKPTSVRLLLQVLTIVALISYAYWAIIIIWRV